MVKALILYKIRHDSNKKQKSKSIEAEKGGATQKFVIPT